MSVSIKTLVVGASLNPDRYSYKAMRSLIKHGHQVYAIGSRKGFVFETEIETEKKLFPGIHTITLYLSPKNQENYYDYFFSLKPKRIIFNPGAENPVLLKLCNTNNIECLEACTLVMLATGEF